MQTPRLPIFCGPVAILAASGTKTNVCLWELPCLLGRVYAGVTNGTPGVSPGVARPLPAVARSCGLHENAGVAGPLPTVVDFCGSCENPDAARPLPAVAGFYGLRESPGDQDAGQMVAVLA